MSDIAITKLVKYVFLDVVGFTSNRSVEAQTDIVGILNKIVRTALTSCDIETNGVILIPTGDGICISILDQSTPFDIHISLALSILSAIEEHNQAIKDMMRKFQVRIGINENVDNIVTDINGHQNLAGAGINFCQRVMSAADEGQILVGQVVWETLRHRERHMKSFKRYDARIKHDNTVTVYQFIEEGHQGLSITTPAQFAIQKSKPHTLSEFEAYYFAHALKHRPLLSSKLDDSRLQYSGVVLLWFLAIDSLEVAHSSVYTKPNFKIHGKGAMPVSNCLEYYLGIDFWVCVELCDYYVKESLQNIAEYFESGEYAKMYFAVNAAGMNKLKTEYPDIWKEFDLDNADLQTTVSAKTQDTKPNSISIPKVA